MLFNSIKRYKLMFLILVVVALVAAACTNTGGSESTTSAATAGGAEGETDGGEAAQDGGEADYVVDADTQSQINSAGSKGIIGLSYNTTEIPVVAAQQEANRLAAEAAGYDAIVFDARFDSAEQIASIRTMIQLGVKGIIVSAIDDRAIIPALQLAKDAGIPVVMEDGGVAHSPEAEGLIVGYVGADNFRAGELDGEYVANRLNGVGKIAVMGFRAISAAYERENGFNNVLKHYPGIEYVSYAEAVGVPAGLENMQDFMQRTPDLDAVYCINDPGCEGAYQALVAAGKEDEIFLVSNDADPLALEYMRESNGQTYAYTSAQWPQVMGKVAVENLVAAIEGNDDAFQWNVEIIGEPQYFPRFFVAPFPITIDTIDDYPEWTESVDYNDIDSTPPWVAPYEG